MVDWLTEPGDTIVAIIRQIAREEAARLIVEMNRGLSERLKPPDTGICGAVDGQRVCLKPPHRGRHKFTAKPHEVPVRPWEPITETTITSGSRHYVIAVGNPVKVQGFGRGGAAGDGWKVLSMERHTETGKINVEVLKDGKGERSRTVELSRIVYKRPRKETQ